MNEVLNGGRAVHVSGGAHTLSGDPVADAVEALDVGYYTCGPGECVSEWRAERNN